MTEKVKQLEEALKNSQRIVFFGGAGVSTESGIPDFRSAQGIFMKDTGTKYSPEEVISHSFFVEHPEIFFDFHFENLVYPNAKPNLAHEFVVNLERQGKEVTVVTQNIDGLHQKAGSSIVYELHGNVFDNYCVECGTHYSIEDLQKDDEGIPRCPKDGNIVRPNIVLYQEGLDEGQVQGAVDAISQADTLIVAGTSLAVYPAAGLINYFNGDNLIVINKTSISTRGKEALVFKDSIVNVLKQISLD